MLGFNMPRKRVAVRSWIRAKNIIDVAYKIQGYYMIIIFDVYI